MWNYRSSTKKLYEMSSLFSFGSRNNFIEKKLSIINNNYILILPFLYKGCSHFRLLSEIGIKRNHYYDPTVIFILK